MRLRLLSLLHWRDLVWDVRPYANMRWSRVFRCGRLIYSEGFPRETTGEEVLNAAIKALGYEEVDGDRSNGHA